MTKNSRQLEATSFHEAGHAVACLLTKRKFKFVTIRSDDESLGHLKHDKGFSLYLRKLDEENSFYRPDELSKFLKVDFIRMAGLVSEKILLGKYNHIGARIDYKNWVDNSLKDLTKNLSIRYQKFLLDYTNEVLTTERNWSNIKAVATALIQNIKLTYAQVNQIIVDDNIKSLNKS